MSEEPQNQITPSEPTALLEPIAPAQEDQFGLQPSTEDVEMDLPSEAPRQIHEPALNIAFDGPADDPRITDEGANQNIRNLPSKKDITLRELLNKMDDFAPIIPDAVTAHYLTLAGLPPPNAAHPPSTPLPLARLIGLATQKFIADIAADAYQFARIRSSNPANVTAPALLPGQIAGQLGGNEGVAGSKAAPKGGLGQQRAGFGAGGSAAGAQSGRTVLTMEDLGMAVGEWGINLKRSEFYR